MKEPKKSQDVAVEQPQQRDAFSDLVLRTPAPVKDEEREIVDKPTDADIADLAKQMAEIAKQEAKPSAPKHWCEVHALGPLRHDGTVYPAGSRAQFTDAEIADLGDVVRRVDGGSKPARKQSAPGRHVCVVHEYGPLVHDGRFYAPGSEVELTSDEVESLAGVVTKVTD